MAIIMELDPATIGDHSKQFQKPSFYQPHTIPANPAETEVLDTFLKVVRLLERPEAVPALLSSYIRELHYWLLLGKHGYAVSQYASDFGTSRELLALWLY